MTFDEWFNGKLSEYAGDNDMRKHHISSRWTYEKAWQASQAQQAQTIAELVEALERIDGWLAVRHLGGLMPNEKALIAKHKKG